jgi:hypothetical protein
MRDEDVSDARERMDTETQDEIETTWAAPCGVCCRLCEFFENREGLSCGGCYTERLCRVRERKCWFVACVEEHGVEHCGVCEKFPCESLHEKHQLCAGESSSVATFRIGDLSLRACLGTEEWMKRKIDGRLPDVWTAQEIAASRPPEERRRYRRNPGRWKVVASLQPASQAFGLAEVEAVCTNASRVGLGLTLPPQVRQGFGALLRTHRQIEISGEFPTSHGSRSFTGVIVWNNLAETESGSAFQAGVRLIRVGD